MVFQSKDMEMTWYVIILQKLKEVGCVYFSGPGYYRELFNIDFFAERKKNWEEVLIRWTYRKNVRNPGTIFNKLSP